MKVSIKTSIAPGVGMWVVRYTVKAGGKVKPKWTTALPDGYPASYPRSAAIRAARAADQAIRNLFRNDRPQAANAAALKRWWKRRHGA